MPKVALIMFCNINTRCLYYETLRTFKAWQMDTFQRMSLSKSVRVTDNKKGTSFLQSLSLYAPYESFVISNICLTGQHYKHYSLALHRKWATYVLRSKLLRLFNPIKLTDHNKAGALLWSPFSVHYEFARFNPKANPRRGNSRVVHLCRLPSINLGCKSLSGTLWRRKKVFFSYSFYQILSEFQIADRKLQQGATLKKLLTHRSHQS